MRFDGFDWSHENEDIVIPDQPTTAIFLNPLLQIVIRQEGADRNDDPFVRFSVEHIPAVMDRLEALYKELLAARAE